MHHNKGEMKGNRSCCSALLLTIVWWFPALLGLGTVEALALSNNIIRQPPRTCKLMLPSPIISASTRCPSRRHPIMISLALAAENNGDNDVLSNEFTTVNNDDQVDTQHDTASADAHKHHKSSPPFLSLGYSLAAILNVAAAMSLLWGSCASSSYSSAASSASIPLLSNNYHYWDPTFTSSMLSYLLLGAGTCQLLSYITKHSSHDTTMTCGQQLRRRLTIGTLLFSTIGLFSIPGEASYHYNQQLKLHHQVKFITTFLLCQLSKLITAIISFVGWKAALLPTAAGSSSSRGKTYMNYITSSLKSTWETMPISNTHPPSFYRTCFILITLGNVVWNVPNLIFYLREMGMNWCSVPVSLIVSSIGRGCLLSAILFVLKEEHASRSSGRKLKRSGIFVVLNMLVGLWAWGVGISQGFSGGIPFNARRAADKFLFGLLFVNNGVLMQLTKMGWIKDRDEIDPDADPPLRIAL